MSHIEKLASFLTENSFSEAEIKIWIAKVYREAGIPDKAEEYYRKALSFESDNASLLNAYANFLVESNRNFNEFIVTIDKALEFAANKCDYYNYLDTKGYGLYKFGKYQEGLEVLQKAWDLAPFKLYFIKSHLDEANKAVAGLR
jgi:Tfp pilus assembly protein PilF